MPNQYSKPKENLPRGQKRCNTCKEVKNVEDFYKQKGKHRSGRERTDYINECIECKKARSLARYHKIKAEKAEV